MYAPGTKYFEYFSVSTCPSSGIHYRLTTDFEETIEKLQIIKILRPYSPIAILPEACCVHLR